jgi:hypothetical protein
MNIQEFDLFAPIQRRDDAFGLIAQDAVAVINRCDQ